MQLSWEWGVDPASPHGLHHSFSCGLPLLGPQSGAHRLSATATVRSATFLACISCFQVIRRPAAPIEFCRPHAPTGLELDPIHYLEVISCTAQFAFRLTGDPEHATTLSCLQRLVVVACLLTLAAGAGVGGWAPKFFLRSSVHAERLLSGGPCGGMQLSWEWGSDPALPHGLPHSYSCGLPFLGHQSGAHRLSATAILQVGHIACFLFCFSGHSTTCCSD